MAIYLSKYEKWKGERRDRFYRIYTIATTQIKGYLRNPFFMVLLFIGWFINGFIFGIIFIAFGIPYTATEYYNFFNNSILSALLLGAFAGSGLISDDLSSKSITLYFSHPIKREDYISGKLVALSFAFAMIFLIPVMFLEILGVLTSNSSVSAILNGAGVTAGVIGTAILYIILFSTVCLAFSSLTKDKKYSAVGIFAIFLLLALISQIVISITQAEKANLVSLWWNLTIVAGYFLNLKQTLPVDWFWSLIILIGFIVFSCIILYIKMIKEEYSE